MAAFQLIDLTAPAEKLDLQRESKESPRTVIGYRGEVTIKQANTHNKKVRTYKTHNRGEMGLFSFLIHALQGENMQQYRPQYLMLYDANDKALLTQRASVAFTPTAYKTENGADVVSYDDCDSITLSFIIPSTQFKSSGNTIIKAALFNNRGSSNALKDNPALCAAAELTSGIPVSAGTSLMVYWKLKFEPIAEGGV